MSLDPANYSTLKANGAIVSITQSGDNVTITSKAFDPVTGAALPNNVDVFSAAALNQQVANYQASLTAINAVIYSLQAVLTDAA